MKITVRINEFKRVLQEARRVVPDSDNALPYLRYVKVDVDGENRATVTGSDLGSAIVQTFEVVDGDVGSFLLHAKQADNFLKRHVDGVATIEVAPEDKATVVKAGGFSTKIPGIDVCLFPQLLPMPEVTHTVSLKFLKKLISQVESVCQAKESSWTKCTAIKLDSDGKRLRAVATDGRRVAIADAAGDFGRFTMQIPKYFLPLLTRRAGSTIHVSESEEQYFFRTESVLLTVRKPDEPFPGYKKVLGSLTGNVRVAGVNLKSAIENVMATSDDKYGRAFYLSVENDNLFLRREDCLSSSTGSVTAVVQCDPVTVMLNADFVLDFLAHAERDVELQFAAQRGCVRFSCGDNYQHLIMPMLSRV